MRYEEGAGAKVAVAASFSALHSPQAQDARIPDRSLLLASARGEGDNADLMTAMAAYNRWRKTRAKRAAKFFYEGGPSDAERRDDARLEALYVEHIRAAILAMTEPPF